MDGLACCKKPLTAWPLHTNGLACLQVHLYSRGSGIEAGQVLPIAHGKVTAHQPVDVQQQVQVKGGRHAQRVVVGGFEFGGVFEQVHPDQQATAGCCSARLVQALQKAQRLLG